MRLLGLNRTLLSLACSGEAPSAAPEDVPPQEATIPSLYQFAEQHSFSTSREQEAFHIDIRWTSSQQWNIPIERLEAETEAYWNRVLSPNNRTKTVEEKLTPIVLIDSLYQVQLVPSENKRFIIICQIGGASKLASAEVIAYGEGLLPTAGRIKVSEGLIDEFQKGEASYENLKTVFVHETGHALGIVSRRFLRTFGYRRNQPYPFGYIGPNALAAWREAKPDSIPYGPIWPEEYVPTHQATPHWRSGLFFREVMHPFLLQTETTIPALSTITVGALQDIGWLVNPEAADAFTPDFYAPEWTAAP